MKETYDTEKAKTMMAEKVENTQHSFTTVIKASVTPMPEKNTTTLKDSHIVPRAVLKSLCRWKAGNYWREKEDNRDQERNCMFRTDIGSSVTATDCTTRLRKLLCNK